MGRRFDTKIIVKRRHRRSRAAAYRNAMRIAAMPIVAPNRGAGAATASMLPPAQSSIRSKITWAMTMVYRRFAEA